MLVDMKFLLNKIAVYIDIYNEQYINALTDSDKHYYSGAAIALTKLYEELAAKQEKREGVKI